MLSIMFKKPEDANLKSLEEPLSGSWISAVDPNAKEKDFLESAGVPREFISSALDIDEQPHVDVEDGAQLFVLKVPYVLREELEALPLGIIFTKDYVVTISRRKTKVIEAFMNNPKGFYTTNRTRFLLQIFWMSVRKYLNYLNYIDTLLYEVETSVTRSLGNEEILNVLKIQKALTYFKNATYGNQRVLDKIMVGGMVELYEQDEEILNDIVIDNKQAIEMIDTYLSITANTMSAYSSIVGNNLNQIMKFLAVFSIALAIPSIMGSFYGMNVPLPYQSNPVTFALIVLTSALLVLLTLYTFSRMEWI